MSARRTAVAVSGAGSLTDRVTIQQATTTPDTQGGRATSWGTLATVWAAVRAFPRRHTGEQIKAQRVTAHIGYEVEIRYRADVTPRMRLLWTPYQGTEKVMQIAEVAPKDGRRERLLLQCGEAA